MSILLLQLWTLWLLGCDHVHLYGLVPICLILLRVLRSTLGLRLLNRVILPLIICGQAGMHLAYPGARVLHPACLPGTGFCLLVCLGFGLILIVWRGEGACDQLVESERVRHPHQVHHQDGFVSLGANQEEERYVLDQPHGCVFSDSCPSGVSSVPSVCSSGEGIPVLGATFQPFYCSPGLYQSVCSGVRVGSSEGELTSSLPGHLASCHGVGSSPPATLGATAPVLSGPGDCRQLGEDRPRAIQQGSVSRNADRHHPRGVYPANSWIIRFQDLVVKFCILPSPTAKMWQQLLGYMTSLERSRSCSDAPASVPAEVLLVSSCGRSLDVSASDSGMQGLPSLVTGRGEVVDRGSSTGASSLSPSVNQCC